MFKVVEGGVPAGEHGRIDLFVKRDRDGVAATWDRVGGSGQRFRLRRVEQVGKPVSDAYLEAAAAAKAADVNLCIIDPENLFPPVARPPIT